MTGRVFRVVGGVLLATAAVLQAQTPPSTTTDVVILADTSLTVGQFAQLNSGQLVVNDPQGTLNVKMAVSAIQNTQVVGNTVTVLSARIAPSLFDVFANNLTGPAAKITDAGPIAVTLPLFPTPAPVTVTAGTGLLRVRRRDGAVILPAGTYGDIALGPSAVIELSGGTYNVNSIRTSKHAQVIFDTTTVLNVAQNVIFGLLSDVAPVAASQNPRCVTINVAGSTVAFRAFSNVFASVNAPAASLSLGRYGSYEGNFVAHDAVVLRNATLQDPPPLTGPCP